MSGKKRRFVTAGFDLDLSYITDRLIAMGFPASGLQALYRNSAGSVRHFLEGRHHGRYYVWNLCSERGWRYDPELFAGNVSTIGFPDHNAPKMAQIEEFCRGTEAWLARGADHVAVVHCKAGKVRCHSAVHTQICAG